MGSTRIDADRRALTHERREARIARKQKRRQARGLKRSQIAAAPYEPEPPRPSATQRLAQQQVRADVDELVDGALERHDQRATPAIAPTAVAAAGDGPDRDDEMRARPAGSVAGMPVSRRERDIAEFRERRQRTVNDARGEARVRILRAGEPAAVADALAAVADPSAAAWKVEREQLERALRSGGTGDVAAVARRALWAVSRDAARSTRRATRDPEMAAAVCVAYAIVARLPRTAVRAGQRTHGTQSAVGGVRPAFWR